jgi:hypothetical protein
LAIFTISALITVTSRDTIRHGFRFNPLKYIPGPAIRAYQGFIPPVLLKNFTLVFLPSFVLVIFGVLWINVDNFYRTVQPLAAMHEAAPASQTILLDYLQCPSVIALFKAALAAHWRVAWFALLAMSANIGPIVAGGIFSTKSNERGPEFTVSVSTRNLWVTLFLLAIYLSSLPYALPRPQHLLPRQNNTMADMISYCYESRLVDHPMFSVQQPDDNEIHLASKVHLEKQLYMFGLYLGKDGRRHFGIDIAGDVYKCDPGRWFGFFELRVWLRKPKVLKDVGE